MTSDRFRLALRELKPSDWERFERLAAVFLASDFTQLRTLAAASGDSGRDGVLFAPTEDATVAVQHSVAADWKTKIKKTVQRVREGFPDQVKVLVYTSNQRIGADADELKAALRKEQHLHLDVRDVSWFLERFNSTPERQAAAEELAVAIADPFLSGAGVVSSKGQALTSVESRTGLVYLTLQWEDDTREKSLTRVSYEALVRAALRGTDKDNRVHRDDVQERVARVLPGQPRDVVNRHVNSALHRLAKKQVRHWEKPDEFCLTFEEQKRIASRMAELDLAAEAFDREMSERALAAAASIQVDVGEDLTALTSRARGLLEHILLQRGEMFANAVASGDLQGLDLGDVNSYAIADVATKGDLGLGGSAVNLLAAIVSEFVEGASAVAHAFLRRLSDGYTLFAFLTATPDVQQAVAKMFAHGEIWLDTTIVLPAIAEDLLPQEHHRFRRLLATGRQAGLKFFVTPGVLEEVERHMNRALTCWRGATPWQGSIPFLLSVFTASGRPLSGFAVWVEAFAGNARPIDDIAAFLKDEFGVELAPLDLETEQADSNLRAAVQEIWHAAHERRRRSRSDIDPETLAKLVRHDVENYVGVITRRRKERDSALGYTSWWLTLDPTAFAVRSVLGDYLRDRVPDSPVLSPDFLANYIALGPNRRSVAKDAELQLPIMMNVGAFELAPELIGVASAVREESTGLPERIIERRVRDALDRARRKTGVIAREGIAGAEKRLRSALEETRADRNVAKP